MWKNLEVKELTPENLQRAIETLHQMEGREPFFTPRRCRRFLPWMVIAAIAIYWLLTH